MRLRWMLLPLAAASLPAGPLDPHVLRLIPPDARFVVAVDLDRYRSSVLASLYPVGLGDLPGGVDVKNVRQFLVVMHPSDSGRPPLTILTGNTGSMRQVPRSEDSGTAEIQFAVLDQSTGVTGDEDDVSQAVRVWNDGDANATEMADQARKLSETYDNWFLAVSPFAELDKERGSFTPLSHRAEFLRLVRSARGGIRLGGIDEIGVEVETASADDAAGAAAVARWLPGFIQSQEANSTESALAEFAENITVAPAGNVVSFSCTLDESKLAEYVKQRQSDDHEQ